MTTLLEQLRPEVAIALEKNRDKYDLNITDLYCELNNKQLYSELNIGTMREIILWADVNVYNWDTIDWRFGTKLFIN